MIVRMLSPVSFGRFQNREIPLDPGVNLIEAPNEAGKSTLAAFISGMLYGFYRRDVKKRLYAPAYDRYLPWNNPGKYFGAMILEHEGALYRLERNFLKDDVKLFEAETGRDVSERMPYNAALRIREPGLYFLGISQTAFEGTLYVPQQAVRAGDELGSELRDRIDALSETGSGGLSASGAIKWLDERREAIGTPRKGASPLGEQYKKLTALAEERADTERKRGRAALDAERTRELQKETDELNAAQRQDEAALEQTARYARWKRAGTARSYRERVEALEAALGGLPSGSDAGDAQLERAIQDARQAGDLTVQADELSRALRALDERIEKARAEAGAIGLDDEACALSDPLERAAMRLAMVESDLMDKREAELAARRALPPALAVTQQRAMERMARFEALPPAKTARTAMTFGLIFAILTLLGFLYPLAFLSAVPAVILLAIGFVRNGAYRRVTNEREEILRELHVSSPDSFDRLRAALEGRARAEQALEAARQAASGTLTALQEAEREYGRLLSQVKFDSIEDYRDALERYEAALEDARALGIHRGALLEQLASAQNQAAVRMASVRRALEAAGLDPSADASTAPEALSERLKLLRARRETTRALEDARRLMTECLAGDDYEALIASAAPEPEPAQPADALSVRVQTRIGRIQALAQEMAACAARRDAIEDACRTISEISGEMQLVQEKIDRLTLEAEAIGEARDRIERASDDMRRKLSPALSRAIALVSGQVTGRYDQLRIDTDLKVQALADGQTVSPDRLSGGTADAIHLALRLGLIEFLMGDKECPVILDDSFAQLDDGRAARMLKVVADFAENRQALLLTCQSRTRRMLEELQIPHRTVVL